MPPVKDIALIFNGLLGFPILFSLLQYYQGRHNWYYLYYSLYSACLFLIFLDVSYPKWTSQYVPAFVYGLAVLSYFFFLDDFLGLSKIFRPFQWLNRYFKLAIYAYLIYVLATFLISEFLPTWRRILQIIYYDLEDIFFALSTLFGIYSLFLVAKLRTPVSRFILWGNGMVILGLILNRILGRELLGSYSSFVEVLPLEIGAFLELVLFSSAIGYQTQALEREKNRVEYELKESMLISLRDQMGPHFISSCLSSLKLLIQNKEKKVAINYLIEFSRLFRLIVHCFTKVKISLTEELKICTHYLDMEILLNEVDFQYEINKGIDKNKESFIEVPPLLFQPFIENAILHGLKYQSGEKKLLIQVSEEPNYIYFIIEDNGVGRKFKPPNTPRPKSWQSTSIKNTEERLTIFEELFNQKIDFTIIDLKDDLDQAKGTRVEFKIY